MNRQSQAPDVALCPHLAAAVLWMSRPTRKPRKRQGKLRYVRAYGEATDHLLAL